MGVSDAWKGQLLCSLAMVLVGSTVVVSKVIAQDIEPFAATVLRHALALPVFFALMRWRGQRLPRLGRRDALLLTVQAAAGSVGYSVLLILGVKLASASDAGIVAGTLPAAAALFSALLLGERPGWRLVVAIALATAGVMAVAASPGEGLAQGGGGSRLAGIALVLAAVACEAVFILASKRLSVPVPALALSTLMSGGGLLLSILPAWWMAQASPSTLTAPALAAVLYYAWVPTVGGFLLWYAGSARTSGVRASLATVWLPVSALLLSVAFLGESLHRWQGLGLACVVAAMLLAALPGGQDPQA
ncbi:drug/metabolite transporter (DMT)-like permease [Acidovorax soli]|uniref:Drug/metabolite transporter (DMT)-like permease n=1 Tax=Acidovorax soli TaxID=592050 RepID=A0A7X0PAP3_9BURK|nr:DMT family transporter [Acidovorax soli]MBB6558096.1 drug/metabolite transporter (DMT)-like permease [Acidovorax soli]